MTSLMVHRGPDDGGVWTSESRPLALGSRRLKIIDLTPHGHQPMVSRDGTHVITSTARSTTIQNSVGVEQDGQTFRSRSDTEVLLNVLTTWGVEGITRLNGIFAFALWNETSGQLTLGRDRLGVKPVYYACVQDSFCFASEIKAILGSGLVEPRLDPKELESYLRLLWVREPGTLFAGIRKLEPGTILQWNGSSVRTQRYWDVPLPNDGPPLSEAAAPRRGSVGALHSPATTRRRPGRRLPERWN